MKIAILVGFCVVALCQAVPHFKRRGPGGPGGDGGDGSDGDKKGDMRAFALSLEFTTLMGKCELYYNFVAEASGQPLGEVPEDYRGVLSEACPKMFKLIEDKTEEEVQQAFSDLASALPLFQCVALMSEKEALEFFVGADESMFLQKATPAFEACNTVFEHAEKAMEAKIAEEEAKLDSSKRGSEINALLRTLLNTK